MYNKRIGPQWMLTTDHPASHYGIPVVLDEVTGVAYGPADNTTTPEIAALFGSKSMPMAQFIAVAMQSHNLPEDDRHQMERFLQQWPTGPQAPTHCSYGLLLDAPCYLCETYMSVR